MLDKIQNELLERNMRGTLVDVYIYPDNSYSIIPLGRSSSKKWIGSRVLNYKETGNICSESDRDFANKIYNALIVSYKFEEMGIEPSDNMEPKFSEEGKRNGFNGYRYLSVTLFAKTGTIEINELKPIDKKGSEWVGKSDTLISLPIEECTNIKSVLNKYLDKACR